MTEAIIYTRPDIVRALQIQLPAREAIWNEIQKAGNARKFWETRLAYAEEGANIFLFLNDIISLGGKEYKYKYKGNKYEIITPAIMEDDVKKIDSDILRTICFLADAPEDNAAKAELKRLLTAAMQEYDDAVDNDTITAEEMNDLMTAADDIVAELKDDVIRAERVMHMDPSQQDRIQPQIETANEIIRTLEGWKRTFRKIAKGL